MDLFTSRKIYTVSEITSEVKACLESEFSGLSIEGEISNFTAAGSGHLYFSLKDRTAQIKCVCFRNKARLIRFGPEDGLQVIVSGSLGVYEPRGEYQLYVESMEPKGVGSLQLAFEQLKRRLEMEGLFDARHKKPLPLLPRCIGIVTSPTGAAIQDILRVLRRRHENVRILIYPSRVQGEGASAEIAAGIHLLNTMHEVDVIIVGRGGGSLEDLWAFNEEVVARAIFESRIPVISAVGHEIDFTISDFVADLRAPTPSAAAELVVSRKGELIERVASLESRIQQNLQLQLTRFRNRILELSADRVFGAVEARLSFWRQHLDELVFRLTQQTRAQLAAAANRARLLESSLHRFDLYQVIRFKSERVAKQTAGLRSAIQFSLETINGRLRILEGALNALSPQAVLNRGYAICRDPKGQVLKDAATLAPGDSFSVMLARGRIDARAEVVERAVDQDAM